MKLLIEKHPMLIERGDCGELVPDRQFRQQKYFIIFLISINSFSIMVFGKQTWSEMEMTRNGNKYFIIGESLRQSMFLLNDVVSLCISNQPQIKPDCRV